jgi:prepilin-type N-terminal cleavage/methylation domain-containing protein
MMIKSRTGFTLVEMLVVVGIIAILVTIMVPMVKGARTKALEAVVQANCASIEAALSTYAAANGGNYPGVALDVMAPYPDFALGDPALYAANTPPPGGFTYGVLGGTGSFNPSTLPVRQQLKQVKDVVLDSSNMDTARWFDSLIAADALSEYPQNPFKKSGLAAANRIINIFCFEAVWPNAANDLTNIRPYILANTATNNSGTTPDPIFGERVRITINYDYFFGYDPNNQGDIHSAAGDFAYVPILSMSAAPFADNPMTPENDLYRWGTNVSGYMLFGFGHPSNRVNRYQDEKGEFGRTGLRGFGADTGGPTAAPACDTPYEQAVYALFNTATYYSRTP